MQLRACGCWPSFAWSLKAKRQNFPTKTRYLHTSLLNHFKNKNDADTIFGNYSGKYYRKGRGVVAYSFTDERWIPFYTIIIDAAIREATFVLDGLLHNEVINCLLYTSPSPRDLSTSRMPSSA